MKKKKHLETKFIQFLLERHKELEEDDDIDVPLSEDEDEDLLQFRKNKSLKPIDLPIEEEEDEEDKGDEEPTDDEILEKLMVEYRKLKKQYESKLQNRKRR